MQITSQALYRDGRKVQPAIGKCDCGFHVQLSGFTNTCDPSGGLPWSRCENQR